EAEQPPVRGEHSRDGGVGRAGGRRDRAGKQPGVAVEKGPFLSREQTKTDLGAWPEIRRRDWGKRGGFRHWTSNATLAASRPAAAPVSVRRRFSRYSPGTRPAGLKLTRIAS